MKIGIDIREMIGKKAGIGQYTYNLLRYFSKIDTKNLYFLYTPSDKDIILPPLGPNFKIVKIKSPSFLWHFEVYFDIVMRKKLDFFLSTRSYIIPSFDFFKKSILIVHDCLPFLKGKGKLPLKPRIIPRFTFKPALKNSKIIIAVSYSTKKDIIRLFNVRKKEIHVIYEGVSEEFKPLEGKKLQKIREKYNLPSKFILNVGTIEPRKNLVRLIKAYSLLPENLKNIYKLVIVGKKGWYYEDIFKTVKNLNLQKKVEFTGYIPDEDLPLVYNLSEIFIYPSLYEGFGLPVLEAMACGIPVITSDVSSLPEIVGDAGILVNPRSTLQIKNAMKLLLENEKLRETLKEKGIERAKKFQWRNTARKLLNLMENLRKSAD